MSDKKIPSNKRRMLWYSIGAVIPFLVIVVLAWIMFFPGKDLGLQKEDTSQSISVGNETRPMIEDASVDIDGIDQEKALPLEVIDKNDNENQEIDNNEKVEKEQTEVEVAPVNDKEDPQQKGTKGAKSDLSKIKTKDKKEEISYGIDVAKWQGVIDWEKVKNSGVEFAMIRVGYRTQVTGVIYEDPYAKYNLQQAQANNIKIGVYFFSTAVNKKEAVEEAKWVSSYIAPYKITYPVAYNCEGFTDPNNRQYGLSSEERSMLAAAFLDYVEKEGYTPMFYASKSELDNNAQWNTDSLSKDYKIWVAHYPDKPYPDTKAAAYTGIHHMWQYTSKGKVSGIDHDVDINIAYFRYDKEAKAKDKTVQDTVIADPTALIDFKEVNEKVTAKIETNLRTVPSTQDKDSIVAVLKNGETVTRTGTGNNGWSRVEYKGRILYAVTSYLTTDLSVLDKEVVDKSRTEEELDNGIKFKKVKEQVTAKKETNLRSEPSSDNSETIVVVLYHGDMATRTGISDTGWSKVEYEGQTLYAVSSFLTTSLNYDKPSIENPEAGITFTKVKEEVTAKENTNLRLIPSADNADTIVTALHKGEIAIRTGIGSNGWSRLEYDGQILYAVTSYLELVTEEVD